MNAKQDFYLIQIFRPKTTPEALKMHDRIEFFLGNFSARKRKFRKLLGLLKHVRRDSVLENMTFGSIVSRAHFYDRLVIRVKT